MKWTTELPQFEGWYWWRRHVKFKPLVVHVWVNGGMVRCDTEFANLLVEADWGGEWSSERIKEPGE
jgi:hypothetical protein